MHKILLIDDDEMVLMMMQQALENEGYAVVSTADGPQGITLYKEHRPDAVLLDIGLPSMTGLEVLKEIREFDSTARVLVLSAYRASEYFSSAVRYGAWDLLDKSVPLPELLRKVRSAVHAVRQ